MFVHASALCAILLDEPEAADFARRLGIAEDARTSPIAVWETMRALVRQKAIPVGRARADIQDLLDSAEIMVISIGAREQALALEAFDRFGKGRHEASLNMGDCFAYACARSLAVPLLFKGDDFPLTDIDAA